MNRLVGIIAWLGCAVVIVGCLGPVLGDWNGSVIGPFGAVDAALQSGILEWSARSAGLTTAWRDLPIFYPTPGMIGAMDSLLGQAWLIIPWRLVADLTVASQYNLAMLLSLILAGLATGGLVVAGGGSRWSAGVAALVLIGSPYTLSQVGHLNQLPPPLVMTALSCLLIGLRRWSEDRRGGVAWWGMGLSLALQPAWGWYGFAYAVLGCGVIVVVWTWRHLADRSLQIGGRRRFPWTALPPLLLAVTVVWWFAQPQLDMQQRHDSFTRGLDAVRYSSADIQHFADQGAYRSGPQDWFGHGKTGTERYEGRDRQVLHPGWGALAFTLIGWLGRRRLPLMRRRVGSSMLAIGCVGLILAFGDSIGLPGTDRRLPLPLSWLRELVPAFEAYRAVWRFSFLAVIGMAWWSAVGADVMIDWASRPGSLGSPRRLRSTMPILLVILTVVLSLPATLPVLTIPFDGRALTDAGGGGEPVLCLPSVINPLTSDVTEAFWNHRALEIGQPVSGGATGWRPDSTVDLHRSLRECEDGRGDGAALLRSQQHAGFILAEIVIREGDDERVRYWRNMLQGIGATPISPWPRDGYETWRLP